MPDDNKKSEYQQLPTIIQKNSNTEITYQKWETAPKIMDNSLKYEMLPATEPVLLKFVALIDDMVKNFPGGEKKKAFFDKPISSIKNQTNWFLKWNHDAEKCMNSDLPYRDLTKSKDKKGDAFYNFEIAVLAARKIIETTLPESRGQAFEKIFKTKPGPQISGKDYNNLEIRAKELIAACEQKGEVCKAVKDFLSEGKNAVVELYKQRSPG